MKPPPAWAETAFALFFLVVGGVLTVGWVGLVVYAAITRRWDGVGELLFGGFWVPLVPVVGWIGLRNQRRRQPDGGLTVVDSPVDER